MANEPRGFTIVYAPITRDHLRAIDARHYSLIRNAINHQLSFEPMIETRNRKPLKRPVVFMATWEIRFGPQNHFRVYYDVDLEQRLISILAIGRTQGNRVVIGGQEIPL